MSKTVVGFIRVETDRTIDERTIARGMALLDEAARRLTRAFGQGYRIEVVSEAEGADQ